jgi:hypothetical protein
VSELDETPAHLTVWQEGDLRKHNPPLTDDELRPNYTLVRIVDPDAPPVTLPEGDPGYVGPRARYWRCGRCNAKGGSRTEVGAMNALLAHEPDCPGPETKDPVPCDSSPSTSPSVSSASPPPTSPSPSASSPPPPSAPQ